MGIWRYGRRTSGPRHSAARGRRVTANHASGSAASGGRHGAMRGTARSRAAGTLPRAARPGARRGRPGQPTGPRGRDARPRRPRRGRTARRTRGRPGRAGPGPAGAARWPASAWPRTPTGSTWCTPSTTSCPRCSTSSGLGTSTVCCSTSGSRRCSSTRPSAASPTPRTRRWTCGWTRAGGHRGRGRQHLPARRTGPGPAGVRRGEVRRPDRRGDRAGAGQARRSPPPPAWPNWSATRSRQRPGAPADTRPSGRSRRCGSRSTASWPRWRRRCRPRWTRSRRAAGSWCCPTSRWRTGSSSRRSPRGPAPPAPVDLPVELPGTGPTLRLLTRGARAADEAEVAANPRAASVRLRAAERIDDGHAGRHCTSPGRGAYTPPGAGQRPQRTRRLPGDWRRQDTTRGRGDDDTTATGARRTRHDAGLGTPRRASRPDATMVGVNGRCDGSTTPHARRDADERPARRATALAPLPSRAAPATPAQPGRLGWRRRCRSRCRARRSWC